MLLDSQLRRLANPDQRIYLEIVIKKIEKKRTYWIVDFATVDK